MDRYKQYKQKRLAFIQKLISKKATCPVYPNRLLTLTNTTIHHMIGREGARLLDERYWLACTLEGHQKIEENPKWARDQGFSLPRNKEYGSKTYTEAKAG